VIPAWIKVTKDMLEGQTHGLGGQPIDQLKPPETFEAEMLHRLALIEAHLIELIRVVRETRQ
jgi:hypothetical protein